MDFNRLLNPQPFAGDLGDITDELAAAYAEPNRRRTVAIVEALGRVLVPVLPHAHPGRDGAGVAGHEGRSGKTDPLECPDEDLVRVAFPGGKQALPIFSSARALAEWNPTARPVPLEVSKVASAALQRGQGVMVLDPDSEQTTWLGRSATAALASGTAWTAPWEDPSIASRILAGVDGELPGLAGLCLEPGRAGAAVVVVELTEQVDREQAANIAHTLMAVMGSDPYVKARLDVVELRPRQVGKLTR
ncbi:SseB family protein [Trueperella pecoris]|uniref:SseB family protein n=1 Tax=Trueperella pecoris TaxID=2733571 RepID=UPI001ABE4F9E|nr:SseB family protein [Trueperella pecoris]QTG74712.1 SseB family protein [Trueperella pecoris]